MKKSLTVGDLKKELEGLDDNLPVYASLALRFISPGMDNIEWYIDRVRFSPKTPISNAHFNIELGDSFGW